MILNYKRLQVIILITSIAFSSFLSARLTTLNHFDPAPNYSANDSMMPPNSHFLDLAQARMKHEKPDDRRMFGINLSGFIQGSNQSRSSNGTLYGTVSGTPENGFEMGDFRGTMYAMGLFLGANPKNGHTIWATEAGEDAGDATAITACSIEEFGLPPCLKDIARHLSGNGSNTCPPGPAPTTGLVFNPSTTPSNTPSVFSESALARDTKYFGAFSMPIEYRKQGFRFELNFNCTDYIGLTIQSGVVNIKQYFNSTFASTITTTGTGQTNGGPYSLSNVTNSSGTTTSFISPLYTNLNDQSGVNGPGSTTPLTASQIRFDKYISNNLGNILNPECGHNQSICSFDDYSIEDVRLILSIKRSYDPNRYNQDDEEGEWPDMIFTPYAWAGGSFPVAKEICYQNLLSLPFGNNGHASIGGGIGMTFDFVESVEVGFEGGATYFVPKDEHRPFPTHPLQRILYPFSADVRTKPGVNWTAKALLNAYQFIKHINFWFTYEFIEHREDCFTVLENDKSQYFVPGVLECKSGWRTQFFNAGLSFDIQPGMQASLVWQQPICPKNAYYPVSILGSINFMF